MTFTKAAFSFHIHNRSLDRCYPQFSSEADFIHCILSYGDLEQHSEGGTLRGLSQFAQGWRRLQAGGLLLPDLVEFYQWLHTQLGKIILSIANNK